MADDPWNVPQTEEGLQTVLALLEDCRAAGDDLAVGKGLLRLAHLVKWVRSDNDEAPFDRSRTLALEALEIFRRLDDARGRVLALHAAAPFVPPDERARMLAEADRLAMASNDGVLVARSLWAQARALGLSDPETAERLNREALTIFLRNGEKAAAAGCLFGLAIRGDSHKAKYEAALESARLYREAGLPGDAARSMTIALMGGENFLSHTELEPSVRQGLADAQSDGNRLLESGFYARLAKLADEKGDAPGAARYRRWAEETKEADGLTPRQRRRLEIQNTRLMIASMRSQGNAQVERIFRKSLRRLRRPTFFRADGRRIGGKRALTGEN